MEHPCSKCGAAVMDGTPFCPQCKNPQIRVPGFEAEGLAGNAEQDLVAADIGVGARVGGRIPSGPQGVRWHQALPGCAIGGLIAVVASRVMAGVPLVALSLPYFVGGATAVLIYRTRTRGLTTPLHGSLIGAASGAFSFLIVAIQSVAEYVYHADSLRQQMSEVVAQLTAQGYDPKALEPILESVQSDQGLGFLIAFVLSLLFIVLLAGSSVGGALCASWLRRR